jgi:hypothetical protein
MPLADSIQGEPQALRLSPAVVSFVMRQCAPVCDGQVSCRQDVIRSCVLPPQQESDNREFVGGAIGRLCATGESKLYPR